MSKLTPTAVPALLILPLLACHSDPSGEPNALVSALNAHPAPQTLQVAASLTRTMTYAELSYLGALPWDDLGRADTFLRDPLVRKAMRMTFARLSSGTSAPSDACSTLRDGVSRALSEFEDQFEDQSLRALCPVVSQGAPNTACVAAALHRVWQHVTRGHDTSAASFVGSLDTGSCALGADAMIDDDSWRAWQHRAASVAAADGAPIGTCEEGQSAFGCPHACVPWGTGCDTCDVPCAPTFSCAFGACVQLARCGNEDCEANEDATTCPFDCAAASCGDHRCDANERGSCTSDCGFCGNGTCDPSETSFDCSQDCGTICGDGRCEGSESTTCPVDCANLTLCGNGSCESFESQATCPTDCQGVCRSDEVSPTCCHGKPVASGQICCASEATSGIFAALGAAIPQLNVPCPAAQCMSCDAELQQSNDTALTHFFAPGELKFCTPTCAALFPSDAGIDAGSDAGPRSGGDAGVDAGDGGPSLSDLGLGGLGF